LRRCFRQKSTHRSPEHQRCTQISAELSRIRPSGLPACNTLPSSPTPRPGTPTKRSFIATLGVARGLFTRRAGFLQLCWCHGMLLSLVAPQ
jgi:hypothetical protein